MTPKRPCNRVAAVLLSGMLAGGLTILLGPAGPVLAHETRAAGSYETVVGWLEEPAYAGFRNAVQFMVREPVADGGEARPVTGAELNVVVIFGGPDGVERTPPMELRPTFGRPGEYRAFLIPSRPGTYTFHVTGTIESETDLDETYTAGEDTFNLVQSPSEVEFPAQDPTRGELADRLERLEARLEGALAEGSSSDGTARLLAAAALLLAVAATGSAFARRPRSPNQEAGRQ